MVTKSKEERRREVDAEKARIWSTAIKAGLEARKEWLAAAKEVLSYFNASHDDFFDNKLGNYMDFKSKGICVSVNRAALIRAVIGPHLYQKAPRREVNTTRNDNVSRALARVMEILLNYSVKESNFTRSVYRAIDQALLWSTGFLRTGWDPTYKINTSWWVSADRVVIDPAAVQIEDARWIAISTRRSYSDVVDEFGKGKESWRVDELRGRASGTDDTVASAPADVLNGYLRDQLTVWEVYSKDGNGLRRGPEAMNEDSPFKDDDDSNKFVKFTLVLDHKHLLDSGEWEIPLYLDKRWPVTPLQFVEALDKFWGPSVMQQALSHQRNADVFASLLTSQGKINARDVTFFRSGILSPEGVKQLTKGGPAEAIPIGELPNGVKLSDIIMQASLGRDPMHLLGPLNWHLEQLDLITGATTILQGGADYGPADRSATASQQKGQAANVRLNDMRSRVEDALAQAGRNEAICWRLGGLAEQADIDRIVGDEDLGWRIDGPIPIPLRGKGWSIEALYAAAATYFPSAMGPDPEGNVRRAPANGPDPSIAMVVEPLWTAIQQLALNLAAPPEIRQKAMETMQVVAATSDPASPMPTSLKPRRVTAKDTFDDTAGMGPTEIVREFSFTVESGSTQKQDPQAKRERATSLEQNALPAALKIGDYRMASFILERADDAFGVPPDERIPAFAPPPPPAPMGPAPAPEQGGMA